ncbi:MAG: Hsp20 family protein [Bacteroidia bacterium]|nr:Hsp20 family protein [Bacteroidia bacterium]
MKLEENAFEGLGQQIDWMNTINGGVTMTFVELGQTSDGLFVKFENPAFDGENYHIELKPTYLTVFATLSAHNDAADEDSIVVPTFVRSFPIPPIVDAEKIEANFEDGILTVFAPFKPGLDDTSRKIDIKYN